MLKKMFRNYDYTIVVPVLLLCGFGMLMVYSSSMAYAMDQGWKASHFFVRQLLSFIAGLFAFVMAMILPYKVYKKLMKIILLVSLLALVAVLLIGTISNHAQSWINIGGFNFQPSEFVKIGLIIYLAAVFSKKQHYISNFSRGVLPPLIVILITFVLISLQPDLGTAMIVAGVAGIMIISSGMRTKHLVGLLVLAGLCILLLGGVMLTEVQSSRFSAAYAPFEHPKQGYQLINSYLAIASGGLTGRGLGESIQKYGFLPESYNDFIMAVVAEELGIFGVVFVIGLLGWLVFRGFLIGIRCKDTFGSLLAIGISGMLGVQSLINLGVVVGFVPVTGVPLPLISYGGSALVLFLFSMGILVNISMFVNLEQRNAPEEQMEHPKQSYRTRSIHQ